jgi:uncharacterized damage-inducible protein DinB
MSVGVDFERLLDYSDHERAKWQAWIAVDPSRLDVPFQPGGRFPTIGRLLDHVFLVEQRHLSRLEGTPLPDSTGVTGDDWEALFTYAENVRSAFRHYIDSLNDTRAEESITIALGRSGDDSYTMASRTLVTHIIVHEIRHLAQIAFAARLAGIDPPGRHDYFFFATLE